MKKAFALLLAVLMLMSLAACSGGTSSGSTPAASGSAAPASSSAGNGETVKVVITLPSMNNLPSEEAKQASVTPCLNTYRVWVTISPLTFNRIRSLIIQRT